jgi:hypothetical protein
MRLVTRKDISDKALDRITEALKELDTTVKDNKWQYCKVVLDDVSDYSRMVADAAIIKCMKQ